MSYNLNEYVSLFLHGEQLLGIQIEWLHILLAKKHIYRLALYKCRHICPSHLTAELNGILSGYIGPSIVICIFHLCFAISTLHDDHSCTEIAGSAAMLIWLMASIEVINKSVNTWVSLFKSMIDIVQLHASSSFCGSQDTQFRYWYVLQPLISIFFSVSEISKPICHS